MNLEELVKFALIEDVGSGDITTEMLVDPLQRGQAEVITRCEGVLSGCAPFNEVFRQVDKSLKVDWQKKDSDRFAQGDTICHLNGSKSSILTGERTALNFLGRLSGIATLTRAFVERVRGTNAVILDTRKTTPLLRKLEKDAVLHGRGSNHRFGLYDMILVKDNHESAGGGIGNVLKGLFANNTIPTKVEVEVKTLEELQIALQFNVDRIMLDNFSIDMIEEAVKSSGAKVPLEVSGGVTIDNISDIAATGVEFISIGALTHSAASIDFSLQMIS
ncbi:nicotinate-nucleotide diphosphorylase (carboxylating) [candidate division LCP-89 bacterium B3_LCP]|uniref:Probable nicotinate-nucleotide pyrophosphorylase [carboxylating] n=1 Tax=candidate division LCP-89 bacterium B3_LCP TaxID=2012998 RepID=A0A532UUF4_UNCL8|nr:MAG: nicotinate-nucleotide diphosphorylase (carboxylating) [candidate division LCP-89 bacterium B3_LCP]